MSAFDITGALIFAPMAWLAWRVVIDWHRQDRSGGDLCFAFVLSLLISGAAVFSIARLCGASL